MNPEIMKAMRQVVVEIVSVNAPIKGTELAFEAVKLFYTKYKNENWEAPDCTEIFDQLVKEGKIKEVEYSLPIMPNRIKSIYFPSTSDVRIIDKVH